MSDQQQSETGAFGGPPPVIENDTTIEQGERDDSIFFAAVETTRMPMIVTDPRLPDNPVVFCNPAFQQMTGYHLDEIKGRNCRFLQGPETDRAVVYELRRAIKERREISVEILNYRKDGSAFWNALFMSPVHDKQGNLIYFFGSQLDVSRRRDAEEGLRQAQKMEALGQLTGGIAHDFNNLLQVIIGYAEALKEKGADVTPRYLENAVTAIASAANRGATLTQQLLAFARKQRLDGRVVNFNSLIEGLIPLIDRTVGGTISVERRFSKTLSNAKVDTTQAEMALLNILINARDAMPDGGSIAIETANRAIEPQDSALFGEIEPGNYVVVSVTDTGTGMTPEIMRRVTEPFFTTKEQGKGTGLGLSMVYGFVKQSGGALRLYSEEGIGTTVRLYFPAIPGEIKPRGAMDPRPLDRHPHRETILIVEDQSDVGDLAQMVLEDFGYDTIRAANGREAMAMLEGDRLIDLLFSDLIMPGGINGIMLAREARRARPRLKVLLTTGYAETGAERHDLDSEFDIIQKPYKRSELATKVRRALDGPNGVS